MAENLHEIEDMVKLAKELDVRISVAIAHEYCNAKASAPASKEIVEIARTPIAMKKKGYPLVNSIGYFRIMAKEKNWKCKPWVMINVGPDRKLVLPCYVRNEYATSVSVWKPASKPQSLELTGRKHRTAKNAAFIVTLSLLWRFQGIFELT